MVGGDTGDGIHIVFVGTDRLAALMDSFPLKIKRQKMQGVEFMKLKKQYIYILLYKQKYSRQKCEDNNNNGNTFCSEKSLSCGWR